jgi:hypothetical protein
MQLRNYQQQSVNAVYDYLRENSGNPAIVCPTGSGKSHIIAQICSDAVSLWGGRVLILAHVKELLEQNADNLLPAEQFAYHSVRLRACRGCEHHTYLTERQFLDWINEHGGLTKFIAEIDTLDQWPPLPIEQEQPGAKLFCSLCKCWLPAKAYVKNEKCPIGNPDWMKPKGLFKETS